MHINKTGSSLLHLPLKQEHIGCGRQKDAPHPKMSTSQTLGPINMYIMWQRGFKVADRIKFANHLTLK